MNFLVLNRSFNDIDHISPVCYKLLAEKHSVKIIIINEYIDYQNDYRLKFLLDHGAEVYSILDFSNFYYLKIFFKIMKTIYNLDYYNYYVKKYSFSIMEKISKTININPQNVLNSTQVDAVLFDWCDPLNAHPALKSFYLYAKTHAIPTFSLPHGMDIHIYDEINQFLKNNAKNIKKENSLNRYDYVITNNDQHKNTLLFNGVDGKILFNLGSARYSKEWIPLHDTLIEVKNASSNIGKKVLVFMPQHSQYGVNVVAQVGLIKQISDLNKYVLYFKPHTRNQNESFFDEVSKFQNVVMATNFSSVELINIADAVIVYGSSIVLEATFKNNLVLYPKFLHSGNTLFEKTNACEIFTSENDFISYLQNGLKKNYTSREEEAFIKVASNPNNSDNILKDYEAFFVEKIKEYHEQ